MLLIGGIIAIVFVVCFVVVISLIISTAVVLRPGKTITCNIPVPDNQYDGIISSSESDALVLPLQQISSDGQSLVYSQFGNNPILIHSTWDSENKKWSNFVSGPSLTLSLINLYTGQNSSDLTKTIFPGFSNSFNAVVWNGNSYNPTIILPDPNPSEGTVTLNRSFGCISLSGNFVCITSTKQVGSSQVLLLELWTWQNSSAPVYIMTSQVNINTSITMLNLTIDASESNCYLFYLVNNIPTISRFQIEGLILTLVYTSQIGSEITIGALSPQAQSMKVVQDNNFLIGQLVIIAANFYSGVAVFLEQGRFGITLYQTLTVPKTTRLVAFDVLYDSQTSCLSSILVGAQGYEIAVFEYNSLFQFYIKSTFTENENQISNNFGSTISCTPDGKSLVVGQSNYPSEIGSLLTFYSN